MASKYSIVVFECDNDQELAEELDDNFDALITRDIKECLEAAATGTYKLVLIDATCDCIDAFDVTQQLKHSLDVPVIWVTDKETNEQRLNAYDCGADDYLALEALKVELHGRLERIVINRIATEQLKSQLQQANEMAFIAMSDTSDLGTNIQFLLDVNNCNNLDELGMRLFQALQSYGLQCSLQMRSAYGSKNMEANGMAKELESKLLTELADEGRYIDYGKRSVMNYERVSLLVKNMPLDDEKKYGAIKDNVFSLLQGADARIEALDNLSSLALEKDLVRTMAVKMKELVSTVDESYQDVMRDIANVVEDMADGVDRSIQFLGMDEHQEKALQTTMESGIVNTNKIFNEGLKLDAGLQGFLKRVDGIFNSEKVSALELQNLIDSIDGGQPSH